LTATRIIGGCGAAGCCAVTAIGWAHHSHAAHAADRIARSFMGKRDPGAERRVNSGFEVMCRMQAVANRIIPVISTATQAVPW
jgi:hypothetical protein